MKKITSSIHINRKPGDVYAVVSDLHNYPDFFVGITKWEPVDAKSQGHVGDKYWVLMQIGASESGGQIRITDMEDPSLIAWTREKGTDHDVRITIDEEGDGSRVKVQLTIRLAGGRLSRFVERLSARMVARKLRATNQALRHLCEHGPPAIAPWDVPKAL